MRGSRLLNLSLLGLGAILCLYLLFLVVFRRRRLSLGGLQGKYCRLGVLILRGSTIGLQIDQLAAERDSLAW